MSRPQATVRRVGRRPSRGIFVGGWIEYPVSSIQDRGYCPGTWFTEKSRDMVYTSTMAGSWGESHAVDGDMSCERANAVCCVA